MMTTTFNPAYLNIRPQKPVETINPTAIQSGYWNKRPHEYINTGQKIADTAKAWWNKSSRHGPDEGNLACAFMVNEILYNAIGKVYGEDPTTVNSVRDDLLAQGGQIIEPVKAKPGDLVLSFNEASLKDIGGATAHIGIVTGPNQILANSSSTRRFNALFDFKAFSQLYPYFEIIRPVESIKPSIIYLA